MYDVLLVNNPLFSTTGSLRITVDADNLALDMAELVIKTKYSNEELYEYDESNEIWLFKEIYYKEILQVQEELKEYLLTQHAI